jgi:VWFA-related protein
MRSTVTNLQRVIYRVLLGTAILAGPALTGAQTSDGEGHPVFRSGIEVVTLNVAVRDSRGQPVTNLTHEDFVVLDNGVPRPIRGFTPDEALISLAVLVDHSGSMAVGGSIDRAYAVIEQIMHRLQTGQDEATLLTFNSQVQEIRPFTSDLARIASTGPESQPWGLTSLYDAIAEAAKRVASRPNPHRAVMVVTDGVDTGSRLSASEVSGMAGSIQVPVHLIVVAPPAGSPARRRAHSDTDNAVAPTATLEDLARWTGGDLVMVSDAKSTTTALDSLVGQLRYQYVITVEPEPSPGWHPLEVQTTRRRLLVRSRGGYMATADTREPLVTLE